MDATYLGTFERSNRRPCSSVEDKHEQPPEDAAGHRLSPGGFEGVPRIRPAESTRLSAGIIFVLGALALVVGGLSIVAALISGLEKSGGALLFGISFLAWGVGAIAGAQMMQAVIDTARNTAEMCEFLQQMAGHRTGEKG